MTEPETPAVPTSVAELPPLGDPQVQHEAYFAADLTTQNPQLWARPENRWPMAASFAAELDRRLAELRPREIVEVGSGSSTLILARYARATGAHVTSLEHDERWAKKTLAELEIEGLAEYVDIHLRPLVAVDLGWAGPWYSNAGIPTGVDFVLIDGPPARLGGRAAVLPALYPHLVKVGWEAWLDDAQRPGERAAVDSWVRQWPHLQVREYPFGTNGAAVIRPDGLVHKLDRIDAADVCVTILTGRRPDKLVRLLDSLDNYAAGLLETAQVVALHNGGAGGGDDPTREILRRLGGSVIETSGVYGIGRATSLLERASRQSGAAYWLHLEDDWEVATAAHGWLDHARELLPVMRSGSRVPQFSQVRLRHASEPTLTRHMVTRQPFSWATRGTSLPPRLVSNGAHLTFNPFLARVGGLTSCFPAESERDFMGRAVEFGLTRSAQLYPGVFRHTGDGDSLRAKTGRL